MDDDTRILVKIVNKDGDDNPTGGQVATEMTAVEFRDWLLTALAGQIEPVWGT